MVESYWNNYNDLLGVTLILLGVLFTIQIYGDFSGYSDIAIGCSRLFGFDLMRNFNFPYFSRSIPEFWRRWHISLMTWFRDYVYFPLGGSRCDKWTAVRNVFIVWAISGLWHGANWTFVCWGLFHGMLLAVYHLLGISTKYSQGVAAGRWLPTAKEMMQMLLTFSLAVVGWIIFRAETMKQAVGFFQAMLGNTFFDATMLHGKLYTVMGLLLMGVEWLQRDKQHALQLPENRGVFRSRAARWMLYLFLFFVILLYRGGQSDFIYFQF